MAWKKKEAITTPPRSKKTYGEWAKIAQQNGIRSGTFRRRVNIYLWNMETAATTPTINHRERMKKVGEGNRHYPKKYIELAEKNGICYNTFIARMRYGWSMEKASQTKVMGNEINKRSNNNSPWCRGVTLKGARA